MFRLEGLNLTLNGLNEIELEVAEGFLFFFSDSGLICGSCLEGILYNIVCILNCELSCEWVISGI